MNTSLIATRYANALFQLGISNPLVLDSLYIDCSYLKKVLKESRDLDLFLRNPMIKGGKKLSVFKGIFESQFHEMTLSFIRLVIKNNREAILARIIDDYIRLYRDFKGIKSATIITAIPLDDNNREWVCQRMGVQLNSIVEVECRTDANIIGGLILLMDGKMVDGSVTGQLRAMRKNLVN